MTRSRDLVLSAGFTLMLTSHAAHSLAQGEVDDATRAAARALGEQGVEAYWAGDFATADAKLDQAYRLYPTPTLGLWSARARVRRDRWVEASERYRDAARASEAVGNNAAQKQAQHKATKELEELLPRIPSITIQLEIVDPSAVRITLDGVDVPSALIGARRPTNRGQHTLVVTLGKDRRQLEFELSEGQHEQLAVELEQSESQPPMASAAGEAIEDSPAATPAPTPKPVKKKASSGGFVRPAAIAAVAVGGASIAAGIVSAFAARDVLEQCPQNVCPVPEDKAQYDTLKSVSTITIYAGAALAVAGLATLIVYRPDPARSSERLAWSVSPTSVSLSGRF